MRAASRLPLPNETTSAARTRNPAEVLFVLVLACASFSLSQTLTIPALPEIARDLRTTPEAASWILTAFLLSASISTPIVGKLGDVHGKGRVLTAVLLAFCAGAIVDALATSIGVVIAGRVLQGVAGGVFPLAFGIVRDTFPRERVPSDPERARARAPVDRLARRVRAVGRARRDPARRLGGRQLGLGLARQRRADRRRTG